MPYQIPYFFLQPATLHAGILHPIAGDPTSCVVPQSLNIMISATELATAADADADAPVVEPAEKGPDEQDEQMAVFDTLKYLDIRMGSALNHGVSLRHVLDCYDQNLWNAAENLLDLRRSNDQDLVLKAKVTDATRGDPWSPGDWMYIYSESFADSDIGLAAMETLLAHSNASLAVIELAGLRPNAPADERRLAKERVDNLALIGFARVRGTPYLVTDLTLKQPSILR